VTCPCGSQIPEAACCARYLDGGPAPSALALMRSRYTAFVRGDVDYLVKTHDPATRGGLDLAGLRGTEWTGLEIVSSSENGDSGVVEFIASGVTGGVPFRQRERSRFRRVDGNWLYIDGDLRAEPVRRIAAPGRNHPCPCGSGKKYKKCHGA